MSSKRSGKFGKPKFEKGDYVLVKFENFKCFDGIVTGVKNDERIVKFFGYQKGWARKPVKLNQLFSSLGEAAQKLGCAPSNVLNKRSTGSLKAYNSWKALSNRPPFNKKKMDNLSQFRVCSLSGNGYQNECENEERHNASGTSSSSGEEEAIDSQERKTLKKNFRARKELLRWMDRVLERATDDINQGSISSSMMIDQITGAYKTEVDEIGRNKWNKIRNKSSKLYPEFTVYQTEMKTMAENTVKILGTDEKYQPDSCTICNKKCSGRSGLRAHYEFKHNSEPKKLICSGSEDCKSGFSERWRYAQHLTGPKHKLTKAAAEELIESLE